MIAVIPKPSEIKVVGEFFELFKTPWEFYVPGRTYEVVLATADEIPQNLDARLLVIYNSKITGFDHHAGFSAQSKQRNAWLESNGVELPAYGDVLAFPPISPALLHLKGKPEIAGLELRESAPQILRIGYDLFQEVSFLLSQGQPSENAHIPTLEIHISLLRNSLWRAGIPFVEVPPIPAGYDFMACLTHDVDFIGIRQHKLDRTMWGFLYRALVRSLAQFLGGRLAWPRLVQNWKAAFSLPFVHFGWLPDFWLEFDRYREIEKGCGSTFFFLPYKNRPGEQLSGPAPKRRAAKYDLAEFKEELQGLAGSGCEIGLHGIDAWLCAKKGREERSRILEMTGQSEVGVRMHWLYFAADSPKALEEAGFSYDSTFGYNDAVGFRGGTAQAFCPPRAENLLELPLNIQDTAMFYPDRMNLREMEALDSCKRMIQFASIFGGALTLNWHTRSLSPERLWGDFYLRLLEELRTYRVWFATGAEIVRWFRNRRALRFDRAEFAENRWRLQLAGTPLDGQPSFVVRTYQPKLAHTRRIAPPALAPPYSDTPWKGETVLEIAP